MISGPLRQVAPLTPVQQAQVIVDEMHRTMKHLGFVNPHVRLPADRRHGMGVLINGEFQKSALLQGLEDVLKAPCLSWDSSRSAGALKEAKSRARKRINPILAEIKTIIEENTQEKNNYPKKAETLTKPCQLRAKLAHSRGDQAGYDQAIRDHKKVLVKILDEMLENIEERGRKLIALSGQLKDFIDCDARKEFLKTVGEGLVNLIQDRSRFTFEKSSFEGAVEVTAVELRQQADRAQIEYLNQRNANRERMKIRSLTPAEWKLENEKYKVVSELTRQLRQTLDKQLPEGLPRSWEVLQLLIEEAIAHETVPGNSGWNWDETAFNEGLFRAIARTRGLVATIDNENYVFDQESDRSLSGVDVKSLERKRTDIAKGEQAELPAVDYGDLPAWDRCMREYGDVIAFSKTITGALASIVYTETGLSKEERSRERVDALAEKLMLAAHDYHALHAYLSEQAETLPPECSEKMGNMLTELEHRIFVTHIESWLLRTFAKYRLESVPENPVLEDGNDNDAQASTVSWTSQAAQDERLPTDAAVADAEVEVTDSLSEASAADMALHKESEFAAEAKPDNTKKDARQSGKIVARSSSVEERRSGVSDVPTRRDSMFDSERSDTLGALRIAVRRIQDEGEEYERAAGGEMSRHTAALTYATQSNALNNVIALYAQAAQQYDKAMKAMEEEGVTGNLGVVDFNELNAKRRACYRKAELYKAFLNSPKSKVLDADVYRTLFENKEFTVSLPGDEKHFREVGQGQRAGQMLELELGIKPVTSDKVQGALRVPYKYYVHFHYGEDGKLEFASVKTQRYRKYAHTIRKQEKRGATGELEKELVKVKVPRVVLSAEQAKELLKLAVKEAGLSRIWL